MDLIWITQAGYLTGYKIFVRFSNSKSGVVDLAGKLKGEVFEPLVDIDFFKNFTLNSWTLEWPNGADLAPEFLYELVQQGKAELSEK